MKNRKHTFWGRLWRFLFIKLPVAFVVITVLWVLMLKWVPVYVTPLMIQRSVQYRNDKSFHTRKTWVGYDRISPELAKAVIASEDNLFDTHNGFDWKQINKAIDDHERGKNCVGRARFRSRQPRMCSCYLPATSSGKAWRHILLCSLKISGARSV